MAVDILILVLVAIRIVVGVSLVRAALRHNERNLFWLASVFFINGAFNIFLTQQLAPNLLLGLGGILLAQLALVMFIHHTFYRDRRSPFGLFLGISLIGGAAVIVVGGRGGPEIGALLTGIVNLFNWGWHTVVAYQAYQVIHTGESVEDWIKGRYQLVVAYCVSMTLNALLTGIAPWLTSPLLQVLVPLNTITGLVLQFLAWVMPEGFRRWLNRNYRPVAAETVTEMSEEEIMRQLQGE